MLRLFVLTPGGSERFDLSCPGFGRGGLERGLTLMYGLFLVRPSLDE
jgi:hypothetical protein